jgi:hypothetical protein
MNRSHSQRSTPHKVYGVVTLFIRDDIHTTAMAKRSHFGYLTAVHGCVTVTTTMDKSNSILTPQSPLRSPSLLEHIQHSPANDRVSFTPQSRSVLERQVQELRKDLDHAWDESLRFLQQLERSNGEYVSVWKAWRECERSGASVGASLLLPTATTTTKDECSIATVVPESNDLVSTPRWSFGHFSHLDDGIKRESIRRDMSDHDDKIRSILVRLQLNHTSSMTKEQENVALACHSI